MNMLFKKKSPLVWEILEYASKPLYGLELCCIWAAYGSSPVPLNVSEQKGGNVDGFSQNC